MSLRRATGSLTEKQFEEAVSHFPRLSTVGRTAAHAVLVDGDLQVDVASRFDVSPQQVNHWTRQVYRAHLKTLECPEGWVVETVILPPDKMSEVRELEYQARLEYEIATRKKRSPQYK